jgi:UDP-GlcNAc:undecaprenyl-phosphate GlcNAc-1-phosphate transferase
MKYLILCLCVVGFLLSFVFTLFVRATALRIGFVDKPGGRKVHANPKPLGGGIAIFWAMVLPILAGLLYINLAPPPTGLVSLMQRTGGVAASPDATAARQDRLEAYWRGAIQRTPLAVSIVAAAAVLHFLGLMDDRRALGPYSKLIVQLSVISVLVISCDLRAMTFLDNHLGLGHLPSTVITILWIVGVTNAFNFLDNMDGLSAGVAAVCTTAFLATALSIEQWFVAAALALLLGALIGFLCFNFAPATIFMGDAGSLVIGLWLGVLTILTTYIPPQRSGEFASSWYSIFCPLIVMAVPLYDLSVVSALRIRAGRSPLVGDTNHLSHRLVARGMSRRTAVLCIYLITATTAIAAILLTHVQSGRAAILIFCQTVLTLGLVALLEQHPLPAPRDRS